MDLIKEGFIVNMNFLAIDTSVDICSISLCIDSQVVDSIDDLVKSSHTKLLATNVNELFKRNNLEVNKLDYIVLSIGPGSYSGLKVGSSFAKGLAFSIQKEIIPINTIAYMNAKLNIDGNYYVAIFSHRDYVFYQEFSDGYPIGEQYCNRVTNLKSIDLYGYDLKKISNINYTEVKPSSVNLANYLINNYDSLGSFEKDISTVSPIYLKKSD